MTDFKEGDLAWYFTTTNPYTGNTEELWRGFNIKNIHLVLDDFDDFEFTERGVYYYKSKEEAINALMQRLERMKNDQK